MIVLRWREVRPVTLRWIGPSAMAPPLRRPDGTAVAAIIGPQGANGLDGGVSIQSVAARDVSGHRALILTPDAADYPDLSVPGHGDLIGGVSTGAAVEGAPITLQRAGEMVESSWTWTPGPIFAGASGILTQTPPSGGWLRQVAVAVAATRIIIDLRPTILLT